MKRILFLLAFALLFIGTSNAQFFAGGSIGFSTDGGYNDNGNTQTDKPSSLSFSFSPRGGFILSDKIWIGAQIGIGTDRQKTPGATDVIDVNNHINFAPFMRYNAISFNKFTIGLETEVGFSFLNSKTESGGTTTDGPKTTSLYLDVTPGLYYELSEKVELEAKINGLNLSFDRTALKQDIAGTTYSSVTNTFGFGVSSSGIITSGAITVGAVFLF